MQPPLTEDSVYRKGIKILQPVTGYRFAIDSVLLAHFLRTNATQRLLEVGSGSGIITVLLSALQKFESIVAVEIQEELASLCKTNFQHNRVKNATVYAVDVKELGNFLEPKSFDLIFSNPPYRKMGSGKLNPSQQKAIARHEVMMKLSDLFTCAETFLKPRGRLSVILPGFRQPDFHDLLKKFDFHLAVRQFVHSFRDGPPEFFLATATRTTSKIEELPTLVIYTEPGKYTREMSKLLTDES
jgi:tRNA1Val (adenine37-N6)-methyltransferase